MDTELIERLAREAGMGLEQWMTNPPRPAMWWAKPDGTLERFASLIANECAKVCEEVERVYVDESNAGTAAPLIRECAHDIRAKFAQGD